MLIHSTVTQALASTTDEELLRYIRLVSDELDDILVAFDADLIDELKQAIIEPEIRVLTNECNHVWVAHHGDSVSHCTYCKIELTSEMEQQIVDNYFAKHNEVTHTDAFGLPLS